MATKKKAAEAPAAAPAKSTRTTASRASSPAALRGNPAAEPAGAVPAKGKGFKVEALQMGFYGLKRRRPGDVFLLEDPALFSEKWMRRVDPSTPEKITTGNQELRQKHDEILGQKIKDAATGGPDVGSGPNPIDA